MLALNLVPLPHVFDDFAHVRSHLYLPMRHVHNCISSLRYSTTNYTYNPLDFKYRVRHFSLCPQHAQMAESEVATLVCPFSIWPGQGFYIEPF